MGVEAGKRYYVMAHAYHHFIGTLAEVTGKREGRFTGVVKVHACRRGWTEFFRDGAGSDTTCMAFPDGLISWELGIFEWKHPTPEPGK